VKKPKSVTKLTTKPRPNNTPKKIVPQTHPLWRFAKRIGGLALLMLAVFGGVAGFDQFWGRLWPIDPEIHPRDAASSPSIIVPFIIKNRSVWEMKNTELRCGVDTVYFEDSEHKTIIFRDAAYVTGTYSIPSSADNKPINFECNASNLIKILDDGSLDIRGAMRTAPGLFKPPAAVLKMCRWIGGNYEFFGLTRSFRPMIFQWPQSPSNLQWVEGPIVRDSLAEIPFPETRKPSAAHSSNRALVDNEKNLLPGALDCSRSINIPYPLFRDAGAPELSVD
jgi:hypothetical protein